MKKKLISLFLVLSLAGAVWAVKTVRGPVPALQEEPAKTKGPINAPVSLAVFSDFQCPYCKEVEPTLTKLLESYPTELKIVFKHYPLKMHNHADAMAQASECAADQGKFWAYHADLFEHVKQTYELKEIKGYLMDRAQEIRLDTVKFQACLESGEKKDVVQMNMQEGKNVLLSGTPTLLLSGTRIMSSYKFEDLKKEIEKELAKVNKS